MLCIILYFSHDKLSASSTVVLWIQRTVGQPTALKPSLLVLCKLKSDFHAESSDVLVAVDPALCLWKEPNPWRPLGIYLSARLPWKSTATPAQVPPVVCIEVKAVSSHLQNVPREPLSLSSQCVWSAYSGLWNERAFPILDLFLGTAIIRREGTFSGCIHSIKIFLPRRTLFTNWSQDKMGYRKWLALLETLLLDVLLERNKKDMLMG